MKDELGYVWTFWILWTSIVLPVWLIAQCLFNDRVERRLRKLERKAPNE